MSLLPAIDKPLVRHEACSVFVFRIWTHLRSICSHSPRLSVSSGSSGGEKRIRRKLFATCPVGACTGATLRRSKSISAEFKNVNATKGRKCYDSNEDFIIFIQHLDNQDKELFHQVINVCTEHGHLLLLVCELRRRTLTWKAQCNYTFRYFKLAAYYSFRSGQNGQP